jgi:hypothetical protein
MPTVGSRKFPYTSAGVKQAQDFAKNTGQKLVMAKKGGKVRKKLKKGGVKRKHHGGRVSGGMKDKQC